jgi:hypothetical protein
MKTLADILAMPERERPDVLLWLDDFRGIYIPRDFALSFADRARDVSGVTAEDWADLERGPDGGLDSERIEGQTKSGSESYWDTWQSVCDSAIVTDATKGIRYRLNQDGALFLIPELMEYDESSDSYIWPEPEAEEAGALPNESGFPDTFGVGDNLGESPDY